MPQPGWYADPDGTPERLRWWDGTRWTENIHGGPEAGGPAVTRRRGPWPWVALVGVAGLVVAIGFGLGTGLLGGGVVPGTAAPAESGTPRPQDATPSSRPTPSRLPAVTPVPRESAPVRTPEPLPSIPSVVPTASPADGCPAVEEDGTLSDGQLQMGLPAGWVPVDGLTWLGCAQSATSEDQSASVTLGLSSFGPGHLQETAEYIWGIALLDAAIPHPLSQTSTPVTVAGLDGWMVTGTVGVRDELDELTVVVVDAGGEDPSVVVTLAGTRDAEARQTVNGILQTLRPA